jgi:hypothetical protein
MYDGQPHVVRVGATVIGGWPREENAAPDQSNPPVRLNADALEIRPGAIHPGQHLTYSVLLDGQDNVEHTSRCSTSNPATAQNSASWTTWATPSPAAFLSAAPGRSTHRHVVEGR